MSKKSANNSPSPMARIAGFFPILDWGKRYNRVTLTSDLVAAIIVTIMLIPQSLAYALLAGLPPVVGLYASILPLVAYAIFGTSRVLAVGPVAIVSLLTAATISTFAVQGTPEYYAAAIALALLSGLMLTVMGLLRLGFLANLLSHPVISGFITASGVIIAASQLKHILGISAGGHNLLEVVSALASNLGEINFPTLLLGIVTTGFLFWVRKGFKPLLMRFGLSEYTAGLVSRAGPVIAIVATTLVVFAFGLDKLGVRTVGVVPQGLPPFAIPVFNADIWLAVAGPAFLISIIGFVESVSVAQTLAAKRRQSIDSNQELVGLGASNIASAFSGGYPVTGGFARSVVNFDAGAETPAAGAYTAIGIALASIFLTPLLYFLPIATLAATIIVAVLSLVDFPAIKRTYAYSKHDFTAMLATIVITLSMGVEAGVISGVVLSIALFLWRTARPHIAVVGQVEGTEHFRNIERHDVHTSPKVLTLRIDESLYFANARAIEDRILDEVASRQKLEHVILQCTAVNLIDASALESLELTAHRLSDSSIKLHMSEVKGPVMDRLNKSDFFEHLTGKVFLTQHQAMRALDPKLTTKVDKMERAHIAN